MAKTVLGPLTQVTVNATGTAVDLSDHCTSVTIDDPTDAVEVTGFSQTYRSYEPGLRECTITCDFLQDYASGSVDATLSAFRALTTAGTVKVKPDTSGTVVYTLIAKMYNYSPVAGGVGDANVISGVEFRNAGTGGSAGLLRGTI